MLSLQSPCSRSPQGSKPKPEPKPEPKREPKPEPEPKPKPKHKSKPKLLQYFLGENGKSRVNVSGLHVSGHRLLPS